MNNIYYKMILSESEEGLIIFTHRFVSIHETPCMHFCVSEWDFKFRHLEQNETPFQTAKRNKLKIIRIHKTGGRIAFDTEEKALDNLRYRKERQIKHLERNLAINKRFLADTDGKKAADFQSDGSYRVMPDTAQIVGQFFRFD